MIPLGSCTMKLNATTEMEPVTPARLRRPAPVRAGGGRRGLPRADRPARALAGRGHRLRPGLDPAERRLAGRAGRAARDPRLPPRQRRRGPRRLPDPVVGARHQRRLRGDGRHAGRRREGRRRRIGRPRRPARAVREARRRRWPRSWSPTPPRTAPTRTPSPSSAGSCTTHGGQVYVDGANLNALLGLRAAGRVRRRRLPPQPAQDVLHPARRRRTRGRAGRRPRPPGAVPARPTVSTPTRLGARASARSARRRTARRASCRSRGPTSR